MELNWKSNVNELEKLEFVAEEITRLILFDYIHI